MIETLVDDMLLKILSFLSPNEKLIVREINYFFKSMIKPLFILECKLSNLLSITHPVQLIKQSDLSCYAAYNKFTIYKERAPTKVHSLFRNNQYHKCVSNICREKRLGYIFFSNNATDYRNNYNLYKIRNIP